MLEDRVPAAGGTWLWLRDGTAEPEPDALQRLQAALEPLSGLSALPAPVLLCSKVVGPDGELAEALGPWYRRDDAAQAIEAAGRRLLPGRAARTASVLVREDAAAAAGPPRSRLPAGAAGLEWTARVLR